MAPNVLYTTANITTLSHARTLTPKPASKAQHLRAFSPAEGGTGITGPGEACSRAHGLNGSLLAMSERRRCPPAPALAVSQWARNAGHMRSTAVGLVGHSAAHHVGLGDARGHGSTSRHRLSLSLTCLSCTAQPAVALAAACDVVPHAYSAVCLAALTCMPLTPNPSAALCVPALLCHCNRALHGET